MEPKGLLLATMIIGLFVFAMGVDHAHSESKKQPKDSAVEGRGRTSPKKQIQ